MNLFKGSDNKRLVRYLWCTPILKSIYNYLGRKYFYLGFPGPEIEDLRDWKDMLGRICAFERPSIGTNDEAEGLNLLEENLSHLGIDYGTYFGLLEQVMMWGTDLYGHRFEQDKLITLYQLDFCDAFTGKIPNIHKNLRFDAIRRLLGFQSIQSPSEKSRPFVMFITVRNEIHTDPLRGFVDGEFSVHDRILIQSILRENRIIRHTDCQFQHPALKAFVYCVMKNFFEGNHIRSIFLPPVHYIGNRTCDNMVIFTILGTFDLPEFAIPLNLQTLSDFLTEQCIELSGDVLVPVSKCCIETRNIGSFETAITDHVAQFVIDPVWMHLSNGIGGLAPN